MMARRGSVWLSIVLCGWSMSAAWAVEGDVVVKRHGDDTSTPPVVFPHWVHRIRYTCYACHPSLFEMKAGATRISMDAIMAGHFCGVCHNGKTAWAVTVETCNRCHTSGPSDAP